jgi:hypothetical protein
LGQVGVETTVRGVRRCPGVFEGKENSEKTKETISGRVRQPA